jgi:hypothetical protein
MSKTIEKRLEAIERRLGAKQETTLFPDIFFDSGQYIEVPKNFMQKLLELLD